MTWFGLLSEFVSIFELFLYIVIDFFDKGFRLLSELRIALGNIIDFPRSLLNVFKGRQIHADEQSLRGFLYHLLLS